MNIDRMLIEKIFEPLAHEFEMLFGKNNFFLARCFCILTAVPLVCLDVYDGRSVPIGLLGLGICFGSLRYVNLVEWEYQASSKPGSFASMNSEGIHSSMSVARMFTVIATFGIFFQTYCRRKEDGGITTCVGFTSAMIFIICILYFSACTPLPPGWEAENEASPNPA